ncbi:MAG: aa3-type cytochrome c oxidase subunit IV [Caulobacteraceae bacterium]
MAENASDYHHGDQDVSGQVQSYQRFNALTKWAALHLAVLILTFSLWFCVGAGFWGGLIPGAILFAAGIWFLSRKPTPPEI